ncbi:MAG: serine hydrolase [Bacteroidetes bacterium]|nr:serine hydrolase [Bacteroidota bacterium]
MKKLALFVSIFCFFASSFAQKNEPDYTKLLKGIDKDLQEVMDLLQAPGFAVAVVVKNEIIYAKGFGYRDLENKVPVDANTLFAIGSCTKAFTSSVLGQLKEDGKLAFDDKPSKHIPYFSFINDDMNKTITIKDMMTHRTGLPRHDLAWFFFPSYSKDSILMRVAHQEPFTGIREQWYYNNFMYLAQGVIAEKITEKSWEDNVQERFFNPLGMTRSNLEIDGLKEGENAAFGYELYHDSIIRKMDYYDIAGMSPAGSINSSVNEMSQWLMTWINGGKYKGTEILSASYVAEATGPQMIMSSSQPTKENPDMHFATYGYGQWWGLTAGMFPGKGYKLYSGFADTLVYPSGTVNLAKSHIEDEFYSIEGWTCEKGMRNTMPIVAQVCFTEGDFIISEGSKLAVFKDNKCRGVSEMIECTSGHIFQLPLMSDETGETGFEFKVFDASSGNIYTAQETLSFENNSKLGTIQNPVLFTISVSNLSQLQNLTNSLGENTPNPFSETTTIPFVLAESGKVLIEIFDNTGKKLLSLTDALYQKGKHQIVWDIRDKDGKFVSDGVYFYRMKTKEFICSGRMIIIE